MDYKGSSLCDTQEMDDTDRELNNVPVGGTWNYTLKPVEQAFVKQGGFMAAWDTTGGAGKKAFAHYESATEFVDALMLNRADQRFAYEVIPHGQPARAYFDIEWTSATLETGHQTLIKLLAYLDAKIAAAYPGASRFVVTHVGVTFDGTFDGTFGDASDLRNSSTSVAPR